MIIFKLLKGLSRMRRAGIIGNPMRDAVMVLILLLMIAVLHALLISEVEGWTFDDALWFTATAGTTVGFGDLAPGSGLGRIITVLFIYIPAIPAVGYITSLIVEFVIDRRDRKRRGHVRVRMEDHIVFINFPGTNGERYFVQVLGELSSSHTDHRDRPVIVVSDQLPEGLPPGLVSRGVKLVGGAPNDMAVLDRANVRAAHTVAVLSVDDATHSDSLVFDVCHQLMSQGVSGDRRILAETYDPQIRTRLETLGVHSVIKPIRAYPELLVRAIISPGAEQIIEALWDSNGEECMRLAMPFKNTSWAEVVGDLVGRDLGTPIAIECADGSVRADLKGSDRVDAQAIYILVPETAFAAFRETEQGLAGA
ncbi:MAG: ion channel [Magnetospiraceae bacterium]